MHPEAWNFRSGNNKDDHLGDDFCTVEIDGERHYFIRVVLQIPIIDSKKTLDWGVWASQSKEHFKDYWNVFNDGGKPKGGPYFGWFANQLPIYEDCLRIKTHVHFNEGRARPYLELDNTNPHLLCEEQHGGITLERAHEIVDTSLNQEMS